MSSQQIMVDTAMGWMRLGALREYLMPESAERDEGFRKDLLGLAHLSLRLLGLIQLAVALVMLAAGIGVIPVRTTDLALAAPNLAIAAVGVLTVLASLTPSSRRHPRPLTAISVWLTPAVLITGVFLVRPDLDWVDHYLMGNLILVQFAATTLPFKPLQILTLGLAIDVFYVVFYSWAHADANFPLGFGPRQHVFTFMVTLACTVLTAILYQRRLAAYQAHQEALRTSEDLRKTQSRLLITENAAAMGRLAAALSHELNSPIGVLASSVETLASAAAKGVPQSDRIRAVVEEARRTGRESAERLRTIVARMQRFTNLDRAEVQAVQINDLIADVIALMDPESRQKSEIEFRPAPMLPRFVGRPQQLSAVFSNLIGNATDAAESVTIESRLVDAHIEVTVADNGPGLSAEEIATAFNPATFKVSGVRMAAGNWGLFNCRQIVQEHGGEIEIQSQPGAGTTVRVTLPA